MTRRLEPTLRGLALTLAASLLVPACSRSAPPADQRGEEPADSTATFVNKVWTVRESSSVAPGTLYVFLSEGTLVIASAHGKPSLGEWKYDGHMLTLVEEGLPYRADLLRLTQSEFGVRVHSPGAPVEITFALADGPPPPLK